MTAESQAGTHRVPLQKGKMGTAALITNTTFTLADRLKIQTERAHRREYTVIGKLMSVHFEGRRNISGLSQSRSLGLDSLSEKQRILWASLAIDWLDHKKAPTIAVSRDKRDYLLPNGITPLPAIPDPRWVPTRAGQIAPRIAQPLVGCPIVGDRACGQIKNSRGETFLVLQPITELALMLFTGGGGFGRLRGLVDPADRTHPALLINEETMQAHFVGGQFGMGM